MRSLRRPLIYNPARQPRQELIDTFAVRTAELAEIVDQVRTAPGDDSPQHMLVIGWRGMGKTTLLHRVAYAVEDDRELAREWLPVLYDEEQYNLGGLADFWLNTIEMVGVATGDRGLLAEADELAEEHRDDALEEAARNALEAIAARLGRRLLLLVDNVDQVLAGIDPDVGASRLREVLQHSPWLMLVGASCRAIEATYRYDLPFYEMFRVVELRPLDLDDTLALIDRLAQRYGAAAVGEQVRRRRGHFEALDALMGGNPRTIAILYGVLAEGSGTDLHQQLEALLDQHTSLYKERLESLPAQMRRVFDGLAQAWDPLTGEELAGRLRLRRAVVNAQLTRLVDRGLVERVEGAGRAMSHRIRERFFALWCLMRGSRRSRQRLRWLVEFLRLLYEPPRVEAELRATLEALGAPGESDSDALRRSLEVGDALASTCCDEELRARFYAAALGSHGGFGRRELHGLLDLDAVRGVALSKTLSDQRAMELLAELRGAGEDDLELCLRHGQLLNRARRSTEAEEAFRRAVDIAPSDARALVGLGATLALLTRWEEARELLEAATELDPKDADAWRELGAMYFGQGQTLAALEPLRRASALKPDDPGLLASLGFALAAKGRLADASRHSLRATELDPGDPRGLMVALLSTRGEAQARARASLEANLADRIQALRFGHHEMAQTMTMLNDAQLALDVFARIAAQPEAEWSIKLGVVVALLSLDRAAEAVAAAEDALAAAPDEPDVREWLGRARAAANDHEGAAELLAEAAATSPWDWDLGIAAARSLLASGDFVRAEEAARRVLRGWPEWRSAMLLLAQVLKAAGRWDEEETVLRGWLDAHPEDAEAHLLLAATLMSLGRHGDAAESLRAYATATQCRLDVWRNLQAKLGAKLTDIDVAALEVAAGEDEGGALCLLASLSVLRERRFDDALAWARSARERGFAQPWAMYVEMDSLRRCGRLDDATHVAHELVAASPDDPTAHVALSLLHSLRGDPEVAVEALDAGLTRVPSDPDLTYWRAIQLVKLDRFDEALTSLRTVAASDRPIPPSGLSRAAAAIAQRGTEAHALAAAGIAAEALDRAPGDPTVRLEVARIDVRLGRMDAAFGHLEAALAAAKHSESTLADGWLDVFIELARAGAGEALMERLEASPVGEQWEPLVHALAIVSGRDTLRLKRVAPETRQMVEELLQRIDRDQSP